MSRKDQFHQAVKNAIEKEIKEWISFNNIDK
jgi:hypothetical protein